MSYEQFGTRSVYHVAGCLVAVSLADFLSASLRCSSVMLAFSGSSSRWSEKRRVRREEEDEIKTEEEYYVFSLWRRCKCL